MGKILQYSGMHYIPSPKGENHKIPFVTVDEVGKCVSSMKNASCAGLDSISNKMLKLPLPYTIYSLTYSFNLCILFSNVQKKFLYLKAII